MKKASLKSKALLTAISALSVTGTAVVAAQAKMYTVKAGDSLWSLSQKSGLSVSELASRNNIVNPNLIVAGQTLDVPDQASSAAATPAQQAVAASSSAPVETAPAANSGSAKTISYTVKAGDSLWQIAQNTGAQVNDLLQSNGGKSLITIGQVLQIKLSADSQAAPASSAPAAASSAAASSAQSAYNSSVAASQAAATAAASAYDASSAAAASAAASTPASAAPVKPAAPAKLGVSAQSGTVTAIINLALQLSRQGIPYVWGGHTTAGFDCSGLVSYVFQHAAGISMTPYTVSQEGYVSKHAVSAAKPGDLLFWGNAGATYHVAIYIGNNQYVAAPVPGRNVEVETISRYFMPSFAGTVIK
ncbi:MAG: LysM peptidoglycan-binding domain-containing protein [Oenococcus sp.]|uniref:C40 family peptidase n=1 Tax=Oenococcus sp. TaxID=1979414 RepID=UPI0039ED023D